MINRTAARHAAHHVNAIFFHIALIDFFHRVLVAADDDGRFVDVEEQHWLVGKPVFNKIGFQRNIDAGVGDFLVIDE